MDNQGVQGAVQQLQQTEQQNVAIDNKQRKNLLDQFENSTPPNPAAISQALNIVNDKSKPGQIGKAIASPEYAGFCQQFIDDKTGATTRYPTAAATWQAKVQSGEANTDISKAKPGDVIEFAPDSTNGNLGHAALITKNGDLQMATNNGIQTFTLKDWMNYSGQIPSGFYSSK